jgi:hypothetical protein
MFQVLDNGKPADCFHCGVHESWNKSSYPTLKEAKFYALRWLGDFCYCIKPDWNGSPVNYDGYGDMIEIREV